MLDLTWWQVFAFVATAAVAVLGGRLLGHAIHRAIYRRVLATRSSNDDQFVLRIGGPIEALVMVGIWQAAIGFYDFPTSVLAFARAVGHIGLLLAIAWGAMRMIDTAVEMVALRSVWVTSQRVSHSLLPLARRIVKTALAVLVGVMILAQLGYAVGPVLVLFAVVGGAIALAAHRPLENVLAAYAILGDHGIREGDTVSLDNGTIGTIEAIGLYSTRLRTLNGTNVIVPNRKLADAQIERAVPRSQTRPLAAVSVPHETSPGGLS